MLLPGRLLGRRRARAALDCVLPARDEAHKTELARFKGAHIVAEREGNELVIFALHDEHGMPATTSTTDKGSSVLRSLADINRHNAAVLVGEREPCSTGHNRAMFSGLRSTSGRGGSGASIGHARLRRRPAARGALSSRACRGRGSNHLTPGGCDAGLGGEPGPREAEYGRA
jgi:hypothetical protein